MRGLRLLGAAVTVAALGTGAASAAMMHPVLGAKLAGMGEHGVVNLTSDPAKNQICWTFDVMAKGITGASIRRRARAWSSRSSARPTRRRAARWWR